MMIKHAEQAIVKQQENSVSKANIQRWKKRKQKFNNANSWSVLCTDSEWYVSFM
jgi:hypothetical protein